MYLNIIILQSLYINFGGVYIFQNTISERHFEDVFNVCLNRGRLDPASHIPLTIRVMTSSPVTQPLKNSTIYS